MVDKANNLYFLKHYGNMLLWAIQADSNEFETIENNNPEQTRQNYINQSAKLVNKYLKQIDNPRITKHWKSKNIIGEYID